MNANDVEDIYGLTPLQHGLLFHALRDGHADAYLQQLSCDLEGPLDAASLESAWGALVSEHAVLRTSFHWEGLDRPVQVVHRRAACPLAAHDWAGAPAGELAGRLAEFGRRELAAGFALDRAPLARLALVRTGEHRHRLFFTFHHLLLDGWSLHLLIGQLLSRYAAPQAGTGATATAPPAPPFGELVAWLDRGGRAGAEAHWRRALAGFDAPSLLAGAPPGAAALPANATEQLRHVCDDELSARLERLARDCRVTVGAVLHAAWALVVARHTDRDDVVIGTTSSGRPPSLRGVERMVGPFLCTLPARVRLREGEPVAALLRRVQDGLAELREYEHTPLVDVHAASGLAPGAPLFDSLVVVENYPAAESIEAPGLRVRDVTFVDRSSVPLTLVARPGPSVSLRFGYDPRRFAPGEVERLCRHTVNALVAMAADPAAPAVTLPLLDEPERRRVLAEFNDTTRDYGPALVPELLARQARRTPDAAAVVCGDERLSYRELAARAGRLARRLRARGVGPNACVGVYLERSTDLVVALLAVLHAGSAYLPLDPDLPDERVAFMARAAGAALVLTRPSWRDRLAAVDAPIASVDDEGDDAGAAAGPDEAPPAPVGPDDLAYVIFTSGSTGRPKGAMNTHRGLANRLLWMQDEFRLGPEDAVLQKTPFGFDVSVWEFLWPLLAGARLVVARPGGHLDPSYLVDAIERHAVTTAHFVPSMLEAFVEALPAQSCASLRLVVSSGEALPPALAARFRAACGAALHNLYGPTEATIDVTHWRCDRDPPGATVPIGRPIANTRLYVLDRWQNLAPLGAPGELYIGGVGVAKGYVGAPELTARSFVADPFAGDASARLFRTGDVVRFRDDGDLEFLGRRDHQVKLRGFRIELGEIEAELGRCPGVRECAVLAADDPARGKYLVAYVVRPAGGPPAHELAEPLARRLPPYMVPSAFIELDALPKTPSGKLDRRALPPAGAAPSTASPPADRGGADAGGPALELLRELWRDVLGRAEVGPADDFFALGGNSLLAMRVASRVRRALGVELPISALFEAPTLAALAARLEAHGGGGARPDEARAEPAPADGAEPFPLTDVQHAYWVGRRDDVKLGGVAPHLYAEFEAEGLDLDRLEAGWRRIVDRHGMLRAVVTPDGRQRVLPSVAPYAFERHDLRGHPAPEAALAEARERLSHEVMSAERWPLFRIAASLLPGGRTRLHVGLDVLIGDAWSWRLLLGELATLYADPSAELPPLELSFRDCVLALEAARGGEAHRRALDYWSGRAAGLPPAPELPARPPTAGAPRFYRRQHTLDAGAWARMRRRAAAAGLTPSAVVLSAYCEVLEQWAASPDFTLNLTLFNRPDLHPQIGRVVGDFTSITLLEVEGARGDTFEERAHALQQRLWRDLDHRQVGGVEVLRLWRTARGLPFDAAMPVVFTSTLGQGDAGGLAAAFGDVREVFSVSQTPQVSLDCQASEVAGTLHLKWDSLDDLFAPGALDDMFAAMGALLGRLADDDGCWHEPVPALLAPADRAARERANDTHGAVPAGLLHEPLLAQARSRPEALAVVGRRALTYGELEHRSRALAHRLRELGAGPGALVAIVMHKGWEQIVAALGALRAGGAYLPIAADLPPRRRRALLEQARPRALVTTAGAFEADPDWPAERTLLVADDDPSPPPFDEPTQGPGDLAYVIFTSGSTGAPKGVMIDHRGARNTIDDINERFGVGPDDRVLGLSSLGFDLSVYDIFGVLGAGGTLVLPEPDAARDPERWLALAREHRVTLWNSVPTLLAMLVDYLRGRPGEAPLASLRLALLSGDWVPVTLPDEARSIAPGLEVVSLGGATEASIWSIAFPVGEVDPAWASIPYGRPLANQEFHALDGRLRPRPRGVRGELYIGGLGLALGYLNDAALTEARFARHPATGARLYRTGDAGRYLPGGDIEFLGRDDGQVKVRGHRIELGEIEAALREHEGVRAAIVDARGAGAERRLVAYVVPDRRPPEGPQAGPNAPPADAIALPTPPLDERTRRAYLGRSSCRDFAPASLPFAAFAALLACARRLEHAGAPKYRYASAGGAYPVELHLEVAPDRISGLAAGAYRYDPASHRLLRAGDGRVGAEGHTPFNRPAYERSAFTLVLAAAPDVLRPKYGDAARDFCLLEAGYLGQLLMTAAAEAGLGLCPIGRLDRAAAAAAFSLGEGHEVLHAFVGGAPLAPPDAGELHEPRDPGRRALPPDALAVPPAAGATPAGPDDAHLRAHLAERLPAYMVPSAFVVLDALPTTANGKIDRQALPDPEVRRSQQAAAPPAGEAEASVAEAWRRVLGVEHVGADDNFFDLGGSSRQVVHLQRALAETFGELPLVTLFQHPTVRDQARALAPSDPERAALPPSPTRPPSESRGAARRQFLRGRTRRDG